VSNELRILRDKRLPDLYNSSRVTTGLKKEALKGRTCNSNNKDKKEKIQLNQPNAHSTKKHKYPVSKNNRKTKSTIQPMGGIN
jgi:hypothetical protein